MQFVFVAAVSLALLALVLVVVHCNAESYSPAGDETPQLPSGSGFPWVSNRKWVAYYYGVYRAHMSGTPPPAWPNPTDRLLSNTQKAALDPVHAFKLRQINELERRCVAKRCVASETAARVSAIWGARYPRDAVEKMYADVDSYLLPATLPDV
jgi:hypothetical protein